MDLSQFNIPERQEYEDITKNELELWAKKPPEIPRNARPDLAAVYYMLQAAHSRIQTLIKEVKSQNGSANMWLYSYRETLIATTRKLRCGHPKQCSTIHVPGAVVCNWCREVENLPSQNNDLALQAADLLASEMRQALNSYTHDPLRVMQAIQKYEQIRRNVKWVKNRKQN